METSARSEKVQGNPTTSKPKPHTDILFGESLVAKGIITHSKLIKGLNEQRKNGGRIGEVIINLGFLTEKDLTLALAEYLSLDYFRYDNPTQIDMDIARTIPENIAKRLRLVAIRERGDEVVIAMADPLNIIAIDTINLKINRPISVVISSPREINEAIEAVYHGSDVDEQRMRDLVDLETESAEEGLQDLDPDAYNEDAASKAPVIRFVNLLLKQAIKCKASDLHIEPQEKSISIRMRVDGILQETVPPARRMQAAIITRIKIMAEMDIAERRLPQDGRFKMKVSNKNIDFRVSTIPTIYGEKIVIRILDATALNLDLNKLGLNPERLEEFKRAISQPHGIILVTGPTGSGKSTTLYSVLNYIRDPRKNITTVEDPVEYRLPKINQIQIKPEINLDFAKCLRAILRQDPDIVLIGEIRDKETVEIAIKASLTGHLVLSTFHTNDAPSAISRLIYMGIEPYLLASSLNMVLAQRLVRKICEHCKKPTKLPEDILRRLNISHAQAGKATFYKGEGCEYCNNNGYKGRLPILEFLMMSNEMSDKLIDGGGEADLRAIARNKGYEGLLEDGVEKMIQGLTTAEEVLSVAFTQDNK